MDILFQLVHQSANHMYYSANKIKPNNFIHGKNMDILSNLT